MYQVEMFFVYVYRCFLYKECVFVSCIDFFVVQYFCGIVYSYMQKVLGLGLLLIYQFYVY